MDFLKKTVGGRPGSDASARARLYNFCKSLAEDLLQEQRRAIGCSVLVAVCRLRQSVFRNAPSARTMMEIGASIFFTEYSISPAELGMALEERGFDSLWVAEHSHIPVTRRFSPPGGGELTRQYYDVMDPFVTLSVAAAVTKRLKLATGVCLVPQ